MTMEDVEMNLTDLRHTPVYDRALLTPNVMGRYPAHLRLAREHKHLIKDEEVFDAGLRLDHLIRNALNPEFHTNFPSWKKLSAIKLFLEVIDQKMRTFQLLPQTIAFIQPRLEFCQEMLRRADQDLALWEREPVSSDAFRQLVITHKCTVEEIVFQNPFYNGGGNNYLAYFGEVKNHFYNKIEYYWR
jgi:hypothetical protein